ncbi:MAG: hypothetical protein HQL22_11010 [Candidatus Omnitrophica bacterium]|nr:hypothetical protein [Candidatus Omnitrophota bacterium]
MSEHLPEAASDKVKSVHLVNIPTKVTGVDIIESDAKALGRLHQKPKRQQHQPKPEIKLHVKTDKLKRHTSIKRPAVPEASRGILGIAFYAVGRFISAISNVIK